MTRSGWRRLSDDPRHTPASGRCGPCDRLGDSSSSLLTRELLTGLVYYLTHSLHLTARRFLPLAVAIVQHRHNLCVRASCFDSVNEGFQFTAAEQYKVWLQDPEQRVRVLPETRPQHARWVLVVSLGAPSDICQSNIW